MWCKTCEPMQLKKIWTKHADKFPKKVSTEALMENWGKLGLTWMQNDAPKKPGKAIGK